MSVISHRERLAQLLDDNCMLLLYSGIALHVSQDEYYPFRVNRNFFYLTGLSAENMLLFMTKRDGRMPRTDNEVLNQTIYQAWQRQIKSPREAKAFLGDFIINYMGDWNGCFSDSLKEGCQNSLAGFLEKVLKILCFSYAIRLLFVKNQEYQI